MYGMTESGGLATMVTDATPRPDTAGRPIPNTEVRIADNGEILLRGPGLFGGYLDMPEATNAAVDADGWLHSGDLGELLSDGHLRILGRKSDLIITAAGETVIPSQLESVLTESSYVRHALVVGNQRPHLTALVELDVDYARVWALTQEIRCTSYADLATEPAVGALIQRELDRGNAVLRQMGCPPVRAFRFFPQELDLTDPEVATVTRKIRRRTLAERHAALIDEMYATHAHGGELPLPGQPATVVSSGGASQRNWRPVREGLFEAADASEGVPYLVGSLCARCGEIVFPAMRDCPACVTHNSMGPARLPGRGRIDQFVVVHRGPTGVSVPYIQAYVRLEDGPLVYSMIDGCPVHETSLERGQEVEMSIVAIGRDDDGLIMGWKFHPVLNAHG
jgi:uncharacterized OB-fold protein